jgi:hypothetical protein
MPTPSAIASFTPLTSSSCRGRPCGRPAPALSQAASPPAPLSPRLPTRPSPLALGSAHEKRAGRCGNRSAVLYATFSQGGATLISPRAGFHLARRVKRRENSGASLRSDERSRSLGTRDHDRPDCVIMMAGIRSQIQPSNQYRPAAASRSQIAATMPEVIQPQGLALSSPAFSRQSASTGSGIRARTASAPSGVSTRSSRYRRTGMASGMRVNLASQMLALCRHRSLSRLAVRLALGTTALRLSIGRTLCPS